MMKTSNPKLGNSRRQTSEETVLTTRLPIPHSLRLAPYPRITVTFRPPGLVMVLAVLPPEMEKGLQQGIGS